ncbi:PREDICTED: coiled-coil domain-containing protein 144B-like [Rhinopithecus bieti]|uniref:coiled-coil domain-containing protein 144B-like n=1 Tax=Rhinopithecus bieti TaxID=61621 RepID=UPI00083BE01A|nr:PREDICTED: coiled-coil domain-containing protein 144B-like [Rhinopithecus bieti]
MESRQLLSGISSGFQQGKNPIQVHLWQIRRGLGLTQWLSMSLVSQWDSAYLLLVTPSSPSLRHLIPECKMEQTPESLPQNNNPDSDRTSEVYLHEELQQDIQKFKNEVNTLEEEFLALKKETVQLQKEVEEEMEKHRSNRTELTGTLTDGATVGSDDDGLNQQIPRKENGEHDRFC